MKMTFTCTRMTNHFHVKGRVLNQVLIERPGGTRKWPIVRLFDFWGISQLPRELQWNTLRRGALWQAHVMHLQELAASPPPLQI